MLGAWLVAAPFVFDVTLTVALWNHIVVGGAIALLSGFDAATAGTGGTDTGRTAAYVSLLGLWTVASPFLLGFPDPVGFWNNLVVGAFVAAVAGHVAYVARSDETDVEVRNA